MIPKTLVLFLCATSIAVPATAGERGPLAILADALIVRPASLAVTVVGSGLFVATLPFSVPSKSTGTTAEALVGYPARMTFVRPLGDLDGLTGPEWSGTSFAEEVEEGNFSEVPEEMPAEEPQ